MSLIGQKGFTPDIMQGSDSYSDLNNNGGRTLFGKGGYAGGALKSAGSFAMKNPAMVSTALNTGSAMIDASTHENNLEYGRNSPTAQTMKNTVFGAMGPIGGVASMVDAGGNMIGSALNKGNQYNEYGYNSKEKRGEAYMQLGGLFDPFSMGMRALEKGGEGSGVRALLGFTGIGGAMQFQYEQEQALEREELDKRSEASAWELNQFNFTPNLDV